MIRGSSFYGEYHGHPLRDLEILLSALRETSDSLIWTAGDSSLDNKYWFHDSRPAVGAYQRVLEPPARMNADVTYWLNYLADKRRRARERQGQQQGQQQGRPCRLQSTRMAAINTAVEATTINERTHRLRPQDVFLRDNIGPEDTLVVSIGGNDVAMMPTPCTICSILSLVHMPVSCFESTSSSSSSSSSSPSSGSSSSPCPCPGPVSCVCASPPCDEHCCGCGPVAMASCICAFPPCLGYTTHLFGTRVRKYIEKLTAETVPKRILVCMIYYPDETAVPSWAGPALRSLGYDRNPETLQCLIRRVFVEATSKIRIVRSNNSDSNCNSNSNSNANTSSSRGAKRNSHRSAAPEADVIPVPLFHVLDGKTREDYVARVEPSSQGGRKMAEYLLDIIEQHEQNPSRQYYPYQFSQPHAESLSMPVECSFIADRS